MLAPGKIQEVDFLPLEIQYLPESQLIVRLIVSIPATVEPLDGAKIIHTVLS